MKRLSIFEITLAGMILGLAIGATYFDKFIPHVHPIHIVVLLIGITIMRFRVSVVLITSFIILRTLLFGFNGITLFMVSIHIISTLSLLLASTTSLIIEKMNGKWKRTIIIPIIIITMMFYLTFMIIGDSDYSPKSIGFLERVRLALIFPGDWLNVTISTSISIVIVPIAYITFEKYLKEKLVKTVW